MTELERVMTAAEGVPWLATSLLILAAAGVLAERATGLLGPATRAAHWWNDREVRRLRQQAALRAERRRIEQEEESARLTALRAEVDWLRQEVRRLRAEVRCTCLDTAPLRASRNSPRVPVPRR